MGQLQQTSRGTEYSSSAENVLLRIGLFINYAQISHIGWTFSEQQKSSLQCFLVIKPTSPRQWLNSSNRARGCNGTNTGPTSSPDFSTLPNKLPTVNSKDRCSHRCFLAARRLGSCEIMLVSFTPLVARLIINRLGGLWGVIVKS